MSTHVVVLGASGYIGEGVALAFRRAGYKVYAVFRNEKYISHFINHEIIPVIGDQKEPEKFVKILEQAAIIIDAIGIPEYNLKFFNYLLEIKRKNKFNKIPNYKPLYIFTSGIMSYGSDYPNSVVDETINPNPTDPNELAPRKIFEDIVLSTTEIRTVVLRPGFVYGGHGGVIAQLFFDINPNAPELILTGKKEKRWSWVHVDDLGDAYVRVAKAGSVVDNQLFNITANDYPTYEQLKIAAATAAGWKGTVIKQVEVAENDLRVRNWETNVIINPQKAFDLLGWRPNHVGIVEEIELYYKSWKQHKNDENKS